MDIGPAGCSDILHNRVSRETSDLPALKAAANHVKKTPIENVECFH